jgi:hypothetical protein
MQNKQQYINENCYYFHLSPVMVVTKYYSSDQIKEDAMAGEISMHDRV